MKVSNISKTSMGIQVIVDLFYNSRLLDIPETILPNHQEWPRLLAASKQLGDEVPEVSSLKLMRVDQRRFIEGLLQQQYSFQ